MKTILTILLLVLGTSAEAADLGSSSSFIKTESHVLQNPASDREGGESIADAVPILAIPFADAGATCDNIDDYEESCPYGSWSPDVVYSYLQDHDTVVNIDLCGSLYDTKVFVYDQELNLLACNDDYYSGPPCGSYVSLIENLVIYGGETYYIVIDGYGGDCGEYQLEIYENLPCCIDCPPDGVHENEPELQDGYVDNYNGGCNSEPAVFQPLAPGQDGCVDLCGISGWYQMESSNYRDTDWFEILGTGEEISIELTAEYPIQLYVLLPDCSDIVIVAEAQGLSYNLIEIVLPSVAGQVYWVWVGPQEFTGWENEFDYLLTVCGLEGPVAVDSVSWGEIKSMYR